MIKKENRLKKNKQFNYIYRRGKAVHSKYLTIAYAFTKIQPIKIGLTVSKKVGKSVQRNRVKRLLREHIGKLFPLLNKHNNYVFIAKEGICDLTFQELGTQVQNLLTKGGLLDNN